MSKNHALCSLFNHFSYPELTLIKYFIEALKDGPKYLLILVIHLAGFIGLILFLKEIEVRPIF